MIRNRLPEICLGACLLGMLPLLILQVFQLWERPHFQFFPLAWLGFGWITWRGAGAIADAQSRWRSLIGLVLWAAGLAVCLLAALLFSPWVAQLATLICIFGWGLKRLGSLPWSRWVAWQALLWCTLPLPGNRDAELIGKLQWLTSQSASSILDVLGVVHLQQGNVLEIRSRKLFVAEACSGVDSLYALAAVSIFIMLLRQKPFVVALFSMMTVPLWAWLGNVIRLTSITLLLEYAKVDLSSGWKHTVLGMVLFALMAFFFFRALEGFSQLFRRFSMASVPETNRQWHLAYNRIVCFPDAAPVLVTEQDLYFGETAASASAAAKTKPVVLRPAKGVPALLKWLSVGTCFAVGVACCAFGLTAILRSGDLQSAMALPKFTDQQVGEAMGPEALPKTILDATQTAMKPERRGQEDFYGEFSRTWTYQDPRNPFVLSIDFPFRDFHPLWVCYTNIGNQVVAKSSELITIPALGGTRQAMVYRVDLIDDTGNASYLVFVNFDKNGEAVDQPTDESLKTTLMNRILRPSPVHFRLPPVVYQGQLYMTTGAAMSVEEKKHYDSIFLEALPHMMSAVNKLAK